MLYHMTAWRQSELFLRSQSTNELLVNNIEKQTGERKATFKDIQNVYVW